MPRSRDDADGDRARPPETPIVRTVLQVRLDEPGGGGAHVKLLMERLPPSWASVEALIPKRWTRTPWGWVRAARTIAARATGADLVHAHGIRAAWIVGFAERRIRLPIVTTVHGFHAIHRSDVARTSAVLATRGALTRSALIFVLSPDDRELIATEQLAPADRIREVTPLFAPLVLPARDSARRSLGIREDEKVFLWIGRLEEEKDPMTFVAALCDESGPVVGLIVGDGSLRAALADACEACSCRFILPGWLPDPAPAYAAADVYVNTSRWEVGPLTTFEAAAAGLPLILSDAPGAARRLLSDRSLPTFAPGDHRGLRNLLVEAIETSSVSTPSSAEPLRLSGDEAIARIVEGYDEVLRDPGTRPEPATEPR